jgi:hypothetical protein
MCDASILLDMDESFLTLVTVLMAISFRRPFRGDLPFTLLYQSLRLQV